MLIVSSISSLAINYVFRVFVLLSCLSVPISITCTHTTILFVVNRNVVTVQLDV